MDHLQDAAKVTGVNILAFAVSLSNIEEFLRIGGLALAFVYSALKIYQLIKRWR